MPEPHRQRRAPRYPVQIPLVYWRGSEAHHVHAGWTRDLSEHGVGVELDGSLRPPFPVALRMATRFGPVALRARVVWFGVPQAEGGTPHGLEFQEVTLQQREFLEGFVQTLPDRMRMSVRFPLALPARCQLKSPAGPSLQGRTGDISRGGAMLYLPQAVPVGSVLGVTIHSVAGLADVDGVVIWVDPPDQRTAGIAIRHGLEFILLDWSTAIVLSRVLAGNP
jgi:hypothetical protein